MSTNNDTPTSTIGGRSLSPSNESRFVPRSSLYASPSASERNTDSGGVNPPNLIDDDDKSLVIGATICFTPEPSPRNTPSKDIVKDTKRSALDLTPIELGEALLSSNTTDEYIGSIIDSKVSSSNVILTTSSLDGKSTTEYEILDKSLEVEDLNLGEEAEEDDIIEDDCSANKKEANNIDGEVAALLDSMSPNSSLPSLGSKDGEDEDVDEDTEQVPAELDDGASTSSPKVDDRPLTPFNNLHKFWEGQTITNMSKNVMGRIMRQDTAPDPVGVRVSDNTSLKSNEVNATPAKARSRIPSGNVATNRVLSYIMSVLFMIGLVARSCASSTLDAVKYCANVLHASLQLQRKTSMGVDPEATDEHPAGKAPVEVPSKSKLFSNETVPQRVSQLCSREDEKDASEDITAEPLDMEELERLRKINSWAMHLAAKFSKMKSTTLQFVSSVCGRFFLSFLLAFIVMAELRMFQRSNISPKDVVAWDTLLCVDTGTSVFDSVPMWEYILSPASFGAASSKPTDYWGFIFVGMTILASALFAYWHMLVSYNSGHWNEKEHHQFLEGYKQNGRNWEAVTKYVPTRSLKQVKNHGNYWLSIRSPGKSHPFSPKSIKVKKEGIVSPRNSTGMTDPVRRVKVLHSPLTEPVKRAKMRLLDKGGQDTSEE